MYYELQRRQEKGKRRKKLGRGLKKMITKEDVNRIMSISENYQLRDALMNALFEEKKKNSIFEQFLKLENDLSYEWFTDYFQENQSNRKDLMQDYTPNCICKLISQIVNSNSVYDECCGIGGLTLSVWNENKDARFYLEEISDVSIAMLLFNLAIRNMNAYVRQCDILKNETIQCFKVTSGEKFSKVETCEEINFSVDLIISNPPYSLKFEDVEESKWNWDNRFMGWPMIPKAKADYAFILHGLSKLNDDGTGIYILPHGVLFRGANEEKIRKQLIEKNLIDAIIGLPEKLFFNTQIPVILLIIKKNKQYEDFLFIDASKDFEKKGKHNDLKNETISKIVNTYRERKNVDRFSNVTTLEEIQMNDYNLNIPRYVDTAEAEPPVDLGSQIRELNEIERESKKSSKEICEMLKDLVGPAEYEQHKWELMKYLNRKDEDMSLMAMDIWQAIDLTKDELLNQEEVNLTDIADIERSKKGKIYPAGCTLIQVSATRGQMQLLEKEGAVESKFAVIMPKDINKEYLFEVLTMTMPSFLARYQTGLNIKPEIFNFLKLQIHRDRKIQQFVVDVMRQMSNSINRVEREVEDFKNIKKYHLDGMFPS
jgi:type I restriction enzyme M protein